MYSLTHPFSLQIFILYEIFLFLPLTLPPFPYRGHIFFPILLLLFLRLITSTTQTPAYNWCIGLAVPTQLLKAFDILILTNAEKDCQRNKDHGEDPETFGMFRKLGWSFELVSTPRGVGWNWEVPYICYAGTETRRYEELLHSLYLEKRPTKQASL